MAVLPAERLLSNIHSVVRLAVCERDNTYCYNRETHIIITHTWKSHSTNVDGGHAHKVVCISKNDFINELQGMWTYAHLFDGEIYDNICIYCEIATRFPEITLQDIMDVIVNEEGETPQDRLRNYYDTQLCVAPKPAKSYK